MSIGTKPKVALPVARTGGRAPVSAETGQAFDAMVTDATSDAIAAAGTGAAIGSFVGGLTGRSERATIAGGIAGGVLGLILNGIARQERPATSELARAVRREWNLDQGKFARLVGYSPRSVASYEIAAMLPPTVARRYVEMGRLRLVLEGVMKPAYVDEWLNKPIPVFDGSTPMQLINNGEIDRVYTALYDLAYGVS